MTKQEQNKLTVAERRKLVLHYTRGRWSCRRIADLLKDNGHKVSYETVRRDRDAIFEELTKDALEDAERMRALDLDLIAQGIEAIKPAFLRGSKDAVDSMVKLLDRNAKWRGYQPPDKLALTDPSGQQPLDMSLLTKEQLEALCSRQQA
ncbi:MAG: hypothetical protein F4049_01810 [Gemmatimonadetes bacterium]|nr:hypothetical protein [Gemmatimonadota bacterium]MYK38935.1 hypothetical protein [Gemmatimonadota bacterium]